MDYFKFGTGTNNLIIIPGISIKPICESKTIIEKTFSKLVNDYTIYVMDRYNSLNEYSSIDSFANDIYDTFKSINISKASVYGPSQGGMIAMTLAIKYPDFVDKLILASTCPNMNETITNTFKLWKEASMKKNSDLVNELFINRVYNEKHSKMMLAILKANNVIYNERDFSNLTYSVDASNNFDVIEELNKIRSDTFVFYDTNDKVLGSEGSKLIINKLKCKYHRFDNLGHACYDVSKEFIDILYDFLKGINHE